VQTLECPEIKMLSIPGLESPEKSVGLGKPWKGPGLWSCNFTCWFKYRPLEKKFFVIHCVHSVTTLVSLGVRKTFIVLSKLIWYVHFLTSCNHVCELSVSWKIRENAFFSPGKFWNLVFASPGIQCFNVYTNPA